MAFYLHKRSSVGKHLSCNCSAGVGVRMHTKHVFLEDIAYEKFGDHRCQLCIAVAAICMCTLPCLTCNMQLYVLMYNIMQMGIVCVPWR